ncbi:hypothetical protein HJFPF1_01293 [Paramyrothecium foliicola]|nr:hypothetical protein HJFPF1_01293 [Paramyrothecium foliicola]
MCQQIVRVCSYCGYQEATCSPSPCNAHWRLYKEAFTEGYSAEQLKGWLKPEICPFKTIKALEFSPGACRNPSRRCASKNVMDLLRKRSALQETRAQRQAAELEHQEKHQEDDFIRLNCQKRAVEPRKKSESFLVLGKRDVRSRIKQEELLLERDRKKKVEVQEQAQQELMDMWEDINLSDVNEDAAVLTESEISPESVTRAIKRNQERYIASKLPVKAKKGPDTWFTIEAGWPARRVYFKRPKAMGTQPIASIKLDHWLMEEDDDEKKIRDN